MAMRATMAAGSTDYHVADLGLAEWGRREIAIAESRCRGSWRSAPSTASGNP